ncbi:beta-1,4-galactosyltransferase 2-like [Notolabrus celidotus]|uniref:beta-1,4-galactosyltransferase 2-like n=1 Tax=Notolabrus celidotus TaxID=1203425 RepID=UPI00148F6D0F|nr:beta-1,4-galactosyltransferase 2-like [Notolabrus celidotus]
MLKKLFLIAALLASFSVLCFAVLLYYDQRGHATFLTRQNDKGNSSNHLLSWLLKDQDQQVRGIKSEDYKSSEASVESKAAKESQPSIKAVQEETQKPAPVNKTIGPCPDMPPNLVGPLRVEFEQRTLDQVREEVSGPLQTGGRFKPTDCVAQQKVAIIVPFRNRHEHLKHWLYYLHPILLRQQVDYGVYVINQYGEGVFNRAKLMNVGYIEALKEYDYDCFVFSDVDLVPLDDRNLYRCFDNPRHLAVAMDKFSFHLPYDKYFGGVSSMSKEQFMKINGFPNTYWGWGGEDDDIYNRVVIRGMQISRPDFLTGRYKMIRHKRDVHNEPNPKNPGKLQGTRWTMDKDGINSLKYTVKEIEKDKMFTFITVDVQAPPS